MIKINVYIFEHQNDNKTEHLKRILTHLQGSNLLLCDETPTFQVLRRSTCFRKGLAERVEAHGPGEKAVAGDHLLRLGNSCGGGEILLLDLGVLPGER